MIAFEIHLNARKICTAGIGELGVLGAHVSWARRAGNPTVDELTLHVGGLMDATREHVNWEEARPLQNGDEVHIQIVAVNSVDEPRVRYQTDPAKDEEARRQYVIKMATELGWQIITEGPGLDQRATPLTPPA